MKRPTEPDTSLLPVLWFSSLQCDITTPASPAPTPSALSSYFQRVWGLIWRCQESSFHCKHIKELERGSLFSLVHIIQMGKLVSRSSTSRQLLRMTCRRGAGETADEFLVSLTAASSGKLQPEKGLKDETQCRDNSACFTSCNVLALERRPPPQPCTTGPIPSALWCTKTGAWALYINTWDYLALIKIHKQGKNKFICSLQQNVSLISCVPVGAEDFWMVGFREYLSVYK